MRFGALGILDSRAAAEDEVSLTKFRPGEKVTLKGLKRLEEVFGHVQPPFVTGPPECFQDLLLQ